MTFPIYIYIYIYGKIIHSCSKPPTKSSSYSCCWFIAYSLLFTMTTKTTILPSSSHHYVNQATNQMGLVSLVCLPPLVSPPRLPPPPTRQPVRSHLSPPGGKNGQAVRDSTTEKHRGNLGKHIGIYWEYSGFMDIFGPFSMVFEEDFRQKHMGIWGQLTNMAISRRKMMRSAAQVLDPGHTAWLRTFPSWLVTPVILSPAIWWGWLGSWD